jgi:TolB protein
MPARRRSAALAVLGLSMLAAAPAASAWPGLNGRVGLTQNPSNKDVWAFARDGTGAQLTFTANAEEQPSWAPDGRRLAFKRSDEVYVRDVTGDTPPRRLTVKASAGETNTQPGWSADGDRIVFRSNRADATANVADIWIMNADGSDQQPLVVAPGDQRYPTFSPDGRRLAYISKGEGSAQIWVADADGSHAAMVYDSDLEDSAPAWSPDGTALAFESHGPVGGMDGDIYVLHLRSGFVSQLTSDPPGAPVHDEGPGWSPDGTMIAFTTESADPNGDIWIMQADGSDPRPLTTTSVLDESPDWQPLPVSVGAADRLRPCGDVSLAPGGVSSVAATGLSCPTARAIAARWSADQERVRGLRCTSAPHSFDQEVVECRQPAGRKGVAFVWRRPSG